MSSSWLLFSWHVLLSFLLLSSHLSPSHILSSLFWAFSQLFSIYLSSSNLASPQLFSSEPSLSPAQLTSSYLSPFQLFYALLFWASSQPCSTYLSLSLLISALCQLFSSLFSSSRLFWAPLSSSQLIDPLISSQRFSLLTFSVSDLLPSDFLHAWAFSWLCFSICPYCRKFSFQTSFDNKAK